MNDYLLGFRIFKSEWEEEKRRKRKMMVFGFLLCKLVITIYYFHLNDADRSLAIKSEYYNKGLETAKSIVEESCTSEEDKVVLLTAIESSKKI